VLLVLPVAEALRRKSGSGLSEHFEEATLLERVQENYLRLSAEEPSRFLVIDAGQQEEKVHTLVSAAIRDWHGSLRSRRR